MNTTRRAFLGGVLAASGALAGRPAINAAVERPVMPWRVGTCTLGLEAAKRAGLDGVEVPVQVVGDGLDVASRGVRDGYKRRCKETGLPICSLMLGVLNAYPLASDPRAPRWLDQAIEAARDLGARVVLVACFGKGDLLAADGTLKKGDIDAVAARLKAAAPRARDAGVVLGLENYLDARQNLAILDRVGSDAVQVYYDVYNTGITRGHDVPADVRRLKDRIAQVHFKNGPQFLGEGKLRLGPIVAALREIDYRGWVVLETSSPSGDSVADARRNARVVRTLMTAGKAS